MNKYGKIAIVVVICLLIIAILLGIVLGTRKHSDKKATSQYLLHGTLDVTIFEIDHLRPRLFRLSDKDTTNEEKKFLAQQKNCALDPCQTQAIGTEELFATVDLAKPGLAEPES